MRISEEVFNQIKKDPDYNRAEFRIVRSYIKDIKGVRTKMFEFDWFTEQLLEKYHTKTVQPQSVNSQNSMEKYNFQTKESAHIFDNINYVVDSNNELQCPADEAKVVKLFDKLFVGIPAKYMGDVLIGGLNSDTTGYFLKGYNKVYFSIHEDILYLRKRN